jgi:hypothetical protein
VVECIVRSQMVFSVSAMISDDVDSDSRSDIIVVDTSSKKADILFNDGNDKFTIQTITYVNDFSPRSISTSGC